MTQFINAKEDLVTDAIDGLLRSSGGSLARLDAFPQIKVVVRADIPADQVAIISGGGSGHEPAHAGFVGDGLLTAAVCGDVFASPSVDAVLAGIMAVTGDAGCLLVVKNYTGDRLNFGLAAERARALGKRLELVVVDDDIALPETLQARGLAGTLLVHKVAGALARQGKPLEDVAAAARQVIAATTSIGMSLDTCTVPGSPKEDRIVPGMAELGLGIHGEPGVKKVAFEGAAQAMTLVLAQLRPHFVDGQRYAVMLNNLGGCTGLEMSVLAQELCRSDLAPSIDYLIGPAAMMTSLDMRGFSLSLLPLSGALASLLREPVACAAWPDAMAPVKPALRAMPEGLSARRRTASNDPYIRALIDQACDILLANEAALNALDAKAGDGDTGSTFSAAARGLQAAIERLPMTNHAELFHAIADELSAAMGGSSGVLLAILFAAAGDAAAQDHWPQALRAGLSRMQEVGGATLGDRTMIDALAPAFDALAAGGGLGAAAAAARAGALATAKMSSARAGRSAYVTGDDLSGFADPGAQAVALLFEGFADRLE